MAKPTPQPAARRADPPVRCVDDDRVKLVAIDLDGTLLRSNKALSRRSADAVSRVAASGVDVVLASARPPRSVRVIYEYLGLETLQINYNGALIYDQPRGQHVFHQPLDPALTRRMVRVARRIEPTVAVSVEILDRWYTDRVDESLPTETAKEFVPDFLGPLGDFLHIPATKLMFLAPPARLQRVRSVIRQAFGATVTVTTSDEHMIQVLHPRVDKGTAVAMLAQHLGVPRRQVMAIGDAPNDLGMIRWAGLGVAVENAWPSVRVAADVMVPSNDRDGVATALERFVLTGD